MCLVNWDADEVKCLRVGTMKEKVMMGLRV